MPRRVPLFTHTRPITVTALVAVLFAAGCSTVPPGTSVPEVTETVGSDPVRCQERLAAARTNPALYSRDTTWNVPAACLPTKADSPRWATNWFNHGNVEGRTDATQRAAVNVAFDEYSTPIYQLSDATTTLRVFTPSWGYGGNLPDGTVPWNPAWAPADGNDHKLLIADPATGREWIMWGVMTDNWTTCATLGNLLAGYQPGVDLCAAMAAIGVDENGNVSDFRTSSGFSDGFGRGLGAVQGMALVPTVSEVEKGSINHAIGMEIFATMFGPACTSGQMATAAAGVDCGYAVAPATHLEWFEGPTSHCGAASQTDTPADRSKSIPEGTRFVHDLTDTEIEQWLDQRGYSGQQRRTARIFAVAMRDYGWIISATACWSSTIPVEGIANPDTARRWAALGIDQPTEQGRSLLDGLITSARQVRTLTPPSPTPILNR